MTLGKLGPIHAQGVPPPAAPSRGGPLRATNWDRRRYIHFYAQSFSNASQHWDFDVLAGDQPPTVTDGYAQWATVARPLRRSLRVFTGYEPISMQVAVRFMLFDKKGSWLTDDKSGLKLEANMRIMEWMAGMGTGVPPLVFLSTYDSAGNTNALIPFQYQNGTPSVPKIFGDLNYVPRWIITSLAWDAAPIRTANGNRIRQDATVTATMYEAPPGSPQHHLGQPRPKAKTIISAPGHDTALKIARMFPTQDATQTAYSIIQAPQNAKLHLRRINQTIKHGKRVFLPALIAAHA